VCCKENEGGWSKLNHIEKMQGATATASGGHNAQLAARGRGVAQAVGWVEVSP